MREAWVAGLLSFFLLDQVRAEELSPAFQQKLFQQGKDMAQLLGQGGGVNEAFLPPEFKAQTSPEARLKAHELSGAAQEKLQGADAGRLLMEAHDAKRLKEGDIKAMEEVLAGADHAVTYPESVLGVSRETVVEGKDGSERTEVVCEEPGEPFLRRITRTLHVQVAEKRKILSHSSCSHVYEGYNAKVWEPGWRGGDAALTLKGWQLPLTESSRRAFDSLGAVAPCEEVRQIMAAQDLPRREYWRSHQWCAQSHPRSLTHFYRYERAFPGESPEAITQGAFNAALGEKDIRERWEVSDPVAYEALEKKVAEGRCVHVEKGITQGRATRMVEGHPIARDFWQETLTYACKNDTPNTCQEWRHKGCVQVKTVCVQREEGRCLKFRVTLLCPAREKGRGSRLHGAGKPFCLDGDCDAHTSAVSGDFADAMSKLSVFKEMAKDFDATNLSLFKGRDSRCSRDCASFRDCCGGSKGWGTSLGLAQCDAQEKALFEERIQGKCHEVGEYCAEKALGVCIRKKRTYCCFQTKLARLVQEQGRSQLGISWGDPKNPACRGLTLQEVQRIDFGKLNLQELFAEVWGRAKRPDMTKFTADMKRQWEAKAQQLRKKCVGTTLPEVL